MLPCQQLSEVEGGCYSLCRMILQLQAIGPHVSNGGLDVQRTTVVNTCVYFADRICKENLSELGTLLLVQMEPRQACWIKIQRMEWTAF